MEAKGIRDRLCRFRPVLYVTGFLCCAAAVFYPFIANRIYERHQSQVITAYEEEIAAIREGEAQEELNRCREYNERLCSLQASGILSEGLLETQEYDLMLDTGSGVMGYLEIPKINVHLPVYHGVSESVLRRGLGHLPETSLPVGGAGSHAVITGHSGMTDRRLFTDLPDLEEGDLFAFHVLGEALWYRVDRILTVLPDETDALLTESGEDYMTLVTCVPVGINSHRLLVRGTRIDPPGDGSEPETGESGIGTWTGLYLKTLACTGAVSAGIGTVFFLFMRRRNNKKKRLRANMAQSKERSPERDAGRKEDYE